MAKTIVITGASDGIGASAAKELARNGDEVIVVGRSAEKTKAVASSIGAQFHVADFADLSEVRGLAQTLKAEHPRIDVLANNAGGMFGQPARAVDGFEKTFQVNHLAPFLLTNLLLDTLIASRAAVLNTSSIGARLFGNIDIDDLNNEKNPSPHKSYGDSKLENILFTKELHRRFSDRGLTSAAFHPGNVATNFASDTTSPMRFIYATPLRRLAMIGPDKGARTLVWLAHGTAGKDWQSGEFYIKHRVRKTNKQAYDADLSRRLWDVSAEMVALPA